MKRFEKDLFEVLRQFEIDEDTLISEVTMTAIMAQMGFVQENNNGDCEAVQTIWCHLQPEGGAQPEKRQSEEEEDNGERVIVTHLKVFLAAILGFSTGQQAKVSNPDANFIGSIDEPTGDYMLSALEVQKVHRRYKQLSFNRTDHVLIQRNQRQKDRLATRTEMEQPTGRPAINPKSQKIFDRMLAEQKIDIDKKTGIVSHRNRPQQVEENDEEEILSQEAEAEEE